MRARRGRALALQRGRGGGALARGSCAPAGEARSRIFPLLLFFFSLSFKKWSWA